MEIEKTADVILIVFASLIILYNFITTSGTNGFDKTNMTMSLFALGYTIFLKII